MVSRIAGSSSTTSTSQVSGSACGSGRTETAVSAGASLRGWPALGGPPRRSGTPTCQPGQEGPGQRSVGTHGRRAFLSARRVRLFHTLSLSSFSVRGFCVRGRRAAGGEGDDEYRSAALRERGLQPATIQLAGLEADVTP